ncbi:MAG: NAD(+)/NADH kinase [Crocinitomicaceae bacterium]
MKKTTRKVNQTSARNSNVFVTQGFKKEDLTISLGGDGTFIQTVGYVRNSNVPIIGINTGRLGFWPM